MVAASNYLSNATKQQTQAHIDAMSSLLEHALHPLHGQPSVQECIKLFKTKTGQHRKHPSWLCTFQNVFQSPPAGMVMTDFDTWCDWMLNGFVVLVQITDSEQIARYQTVS